MVIKKMLANSYKWISGSLERASGGMSYTGDELIVLCMHSTPADRLHDFENLLNFLLKYFKPLSPSMLDDYYAGKLSDGPYVLFTFDDGLKNNLSAAAALEKRGIRAYFFLIPDFISAEDQKVYYLRNIRAVIDPLFDKKPEDFTPMGYEDARNLISKGHAIGSHTKSHLLRAGQPQQVQLEEINGSKSVLESELGKIEAFCSPINSLLSVDALGKRLIGENYRFHFTTFPGLQIESKNPLLIYRRNIEVNWSRGRISFALGKWDLPRWQSGISRFRTL